MKNVIPFLQFDSYILRMNLLPKSRFLTGFIAASLVFGTSALAVNVQNSPDTGYLLCYNTSTKAVTFPGSLKCPKGTKPLELGTKGATGTPGINGINGRDGLPGPKGEPGPAGQNGKDGIDGLDGTNGLDGVSPITFNAYIAEQNVLVTNATSGKRFIVLRLSDLVGDVKDPVDYLLSAQVDITFSESVDDAKKIAWCAWRDSKDWQTTDEYYGSFGYSNIQGDNLFYSVQIPARATLSLDEDSNDRYLTCTMFGSGSVTGGFITAQQIIGEFMDTIGG